MAKNSRLGAKGACNQRKEDFKQLTYSRMQSASSATGENVLQWEQLPLSFAQWLSAPFLGFKGSNPLQGITYVYPSLISSASSFGHVGRSFPPPRSSFVIVVERAGTKDYISNV